MREVKKLGNDIKHEVFSVFESAKLGRLGSIVHLLPPLYPAQKIQETSVPRLRQCCTYHSDFTQSTISEAQSLEIYKAQKPEENEVIEKPKSCKTKIPSQKLEESLKNDLLILDVDYVSRGLAFIFGVFSVCLDLKEIV
jgi:hypothetical protein